MSEYTPLLQVIFQIVSTYLFMIVLMRAAKAKLDRLTLIASLGLSIFLGYFLFWFVEVMVACLASGIILHLIHKKRRAGRKHVPPDLEEDRRPQNE